MEFRVFGPVELWVDGRPCDLGTAKERFLLAILLQTPGQPVSIESLIDNIWEVAPSKARGNVHSYVARLRGRLSRYLGDAQVRVTSRTGAYTLEIDPERVDVHRFQRLYRQARAIAESGDEEHAIALLREAESLWRGEPMTGLSGEWVTRVRTGLMNEYRAVVGERIALELNAGRHVDLVPELYQLVAQHPHDERFVEQLMVTLYRGGRQGDALHAYRRARDSLVADLGAEPGASLRRTHERILNGDTELAAAPARRVPAHAPPVDNLPYDTPDFTGREAELRRLYDLLDPTPTAVTIEAIDGMAGVGKTALAVHAARRLGQRYPDGRLYLHLHAHDPDHPALDPANGLETLLRLIGEPPDRIPAMLTDRAALWRTRLANRRVLVVLDDAAGPEQVRQFLPGAPGCLLLITSRRRLTGLEGIRPLSLDVLPPDEAALLFRRIIGEDRRVEFHAVDEVTRLCGHLPLAITIVADQLRHRPARNVDDLVAKLVEAASRVAEIQSGDRSLAAAFYLSYRELSLELRRAFRLLSLHIGSDFTPDVAASIIGCGRSDAESALEALIDHHLLQEVHSRRMRFHDLLREFAQDRAKAEENSTELRNVEQRQLDFYLNAAESADRTLYPHHRRFKDTKLKRPDAQFITFDSSAAKDWLQAERPNLFSCVRYSSDHGLTEYTVPLALVIATYLERAAHWKDAEQIYEVARDVARRTSDRQGEARIGLELSLVLSRTGNYGAAGRHAHTSLQTFESLGDRLGEAETFDHLARVCWLSGRNRTAISYAEEALARFRIEGERHGEASALLHKGISLSYLGRTAEAVHNFQASLEISRELGDFSHEAVCLNNLGKIQLDKGYHREALELIQKSLSILREAGWRQYEAIALNNVANIHKYRGRHHEALHFYREALTVYNKTGDRRNEADALTNIGTTYVHLERHAEALIHFQKALTLSRAIGDGYEEARALYGIGEAQRCGGRYRAAHESFHQGLALARKVADPDMEAHCLQALGDVLVDTQGIDEARPYWEQALAIFDRLDTSAAAGLRVRLQVLDPANL